MRKNGKTKTLDIRNKVSYGDVLFLSYFRSTLRYDKARLIIETLDDAILVVKAVCQNGLVCLCRLTIDVCAEVAIIVYVPCVARCRGSYLVIGSSVHSKMGKRGCFGVKTIGLLVGIVKSTLKYQSVVL